MTIHSASIIYSILWGVICQYRWREINALHTLWPDAILLLFVWHVLNAVWRWLWEGNHKIQKEDRPHLLKTFRDVLYAKTQSEYIAKKEELLSDDICLRYPHYIKHLEVGYFSRNEAWTLFFRNDKKLPTHSTKTSNYIKAFFIY